ncbi:MAG: thioredoxin family protein, partial [Bacteroidaceae bacterium]|nr:thioredoxin family protein [Bacteroidaceae bacterium]
LVSFAQFMKPVKVTASIKETSSTEAVITFVANINSGWHMYSTQKMDGPTSTTINVEKISGATLEGALTPATTPIKKFEEMFGTDVYYFENSATFTQKVKLLGGKYEIEGYLEYGACNDQNCIPPTPAEFSFSGEVATPKAKEEPKPDVKPEEEVVREQPPLDSTQLSTLNTQLSTDSVSLSDAIPPAYSIWSPVIDQLSAFDEGGNSDTSNTSLWQIFLLGLLGGLVALVTPCVWPIIPMTVSFFLKRGTTKKSTEEEKAAAKKRGIRDAVLYGISIIIIYVTLGLVITAIFGASALNDLATNAVFNILFFLMLLIFGISFIGGFEITLPSKWNTAVDNKASSTTGILSIFLMAFTLVLVSFSCTGPIIGFLLVQVVTSSIVGPVIGMLGFAIALALPFTLFALFPQWLNTVPKSGNWMNVVKVTLGFVEIAFALKFFSVADLAYGWGLLDREVFLSLWIVLAILLGAYLIGWIRFPHDEEEYDEMGNVVMHPKTSIPRFFMALISFAFAIYMIPGLWGAPLKAVSAFAPPMKTQDFNLAPEQEVKPMFTDYEEGMNYARTHHLPVMIDFTGYGCVNCRKMEAAVFTDPTVADIMTNKYVLIQLYVDDKTKLPEPIEVIETGDGNPIFSVGVTADFKVSASDGENSYEYNKTYDSNTRKLRTVGDRWSYLQSTKFGATAQPFYVLLDNNGNPLERSYSYDEDIQKFIDWLNSGLARYL